MTSSNRLFRRGFTLIELLVSISIVAILMASLVYSMKAAKERAKIQKAVADVKAITNAILAYENYKDGNALDDMDDLDADAKTVGFLLGNNEKSRGGTIPVLLAAQLQKGNAICDPWGTPYKIKIVNGEVPVVNPVTAGNLQTGYHLPNFYCLSKGERTE